MEDAEEQIQQLKKENNYLEKRLWDLYSKLQKLREEQETIVLSDSDEENKDNSNFPIKENDDKTKTTEDQYLLQIKLLEDQVRHLEAKVDDLERLHKEEIRQISNERDRAKTELGYF